MPEGQPGVRQLLYVPGQDAVRAGPGGRRQEQAEHLQPPAPLGRRCQGVGQRIDYVFVASWADFFSKEADDWRAEAWAIIKRCPNLIFQVLTKRHGRIADHLPPDWGDGYENVWLGVSAENAEWWDRRVPALNSVPAKVKFVSYEPALGSIEGCSAAGIDWVIIGGESGADARPFELRWAKTAIDICERDGAKPFVKQLGAFVKDDACLSEPLKDQRFYRLILKDSHGGEEDEWPEWLRGQRHFPVSK
jgi:protein gp37